MNPTEIILIRHAETAPNLEFRLCGWTDSPLTPRGLRQAERVGEHVTAVYRPDVVYSSPLERARVTAQAIAGPLDLPVLLADGLKEINFGDCEGLTEAEFRQRHADLARVTRNGWSGDFSWPGGESRDAFYRRATTTFQTLLDSHAGQKIAVVSHGGTIAAYLSWIAAGDPRRWREYLGCNCSLSRIVFGPDGPAVQPLNEFSFLGELIGAGIGAP